MFYLVCYCSSIFFAYLAKKSRRRSEFIAFSVFSIAITVLLAGLRDISIGIDTSNYFYGSWYRAMSLRDLPFMDYVREYIALSRDRFEVLFAFLLGTIARTTEDYQVFLTSMHLIIVTCVYIGAFRMRDHVTPELTLFLFYLLYYGKSLNIFRQYVALAILFAVAADIEQRKHLRYLIFTLVATMVHNTAIIGLVPLLLFRMLYPAKEKKKVSTFRKALTFTAISVGTGLFIPFVEFLIRTGVISQKYQYYLDGGESSSYIVSLSFLFVEVIALVLLRKGFLKNNTYSDFYFLTPIAFLMLYLMGTSLSYGNRIAAYLSCINLVSVGMMINGQRIAKYRTLVRWGIILAALLYWGYIYLYGNASRTMPYKFFF